MRGLAPAALPLVLALVATLAQDLGQPWRPAMWWVRVSLVACASSFVLMLQVAEDNPYMTWSELMAGRAPAAVAIAQSLPQCGLSSTCVGLAGMRLANARKSQPPHCCCSG